MEAQEGAAADDEELEPAASAMLDTLGASAPVRTVGGAPAAAAAIWRLACLLATGTSAGPVAA